MSGLLITKFIEALLILSAANAILFGTAVWRVFVACPATGCVRAINYQVYRGTPDPASVFLMEGATAILFGSAVFVFSWPVW